MLKLIHRLLAEPLTKNKDIDDPETTIIRKQIIQKKKYLNKIYYEWYNTLIANIPNNSRYLEIGSGAGFIKKIKPDIITSEFFQIEGVDKVIDAQNISFEDQELDGILMIDVFHHISNVEKFQMAFAASFIDMIWYTFVSLIVGNSLIRKNFKNTKVLNKISTTILVFISIYILVKIFT